MSKKLLIGLAGLLLVLVAAGCSYGQASMAPAYDMEKEVVVKQIVEGETEEKGHREQGEDAEDDQGVGATGDETDEVPRRLPPARRPAEEGGDGGDEEHPQEGQEKEEHEKDKERRQLQVLSRRR